MDILGSVALVTGANRGLGRELSARLLDLGANTVYAAVRDPASVTDERLVPVRLDVTDPASIRHVASVCTDVSILVNNAGLDIAGSLLTADIAAVRREWETNFLGPVELIRAFAPVLAHNGGGAIVDVLSVLSWVGTSRHGSYAASKAAAWSLTNSVRSELRGQGTQVLGVHIGYMDTDMTAGIDAPKVPAAVVARRVVDALLEGADEVLADDVSHAVKAKLAGPPTALPF
jgi:NAD(P)-dependent dehydrogenase (short-subunit alcohol dehydrogenase family)